VTLAKVLQGGIICRKGEERVEGWDDTVLFPTNLFSYLMVFT